MFKPPVIISIILLIAAMVSSWLILSSTAIKLNDFELITSLLAIFACASGLIAAVFVAYSYVYTNYAFILSQRPSLLIWVKSEHRAVSPQDNTVVPNNTVVPITFIYYQNTTGNSFYDLTLIVKVQAGNRITDISDLFKPNMYMAGHDSRNRWFDTIKLLKERRVDINSETAAGNSVTLSIGYSHTFNRKLETIAVQEYKWNPQIQHWEIV